MKPWNGLDDAGRHHPCARCNYRVKRGCKDTQTLRNCVFCPAMAPVEVGGTWITIGECRRIRYMTPLHAISHITTRMARLFFPRLLNITRNATRLTMATNRRRGSASPSVGPMSDSNDAAARLRAAGNGRGPKARRRVQRRENSGSAEPSSGSQHATYPDTETVSALSVKRHGEVIARNGRRFSRASRPASRR